MIITPLELRITSKNKTDIYKITYKDKDKDITILKKVDKPLFVRNNFDQNRGGRNFKKL